MKSVLLFIGTFLSVSAAHAGGYYLVEKIMNGNTGSYNNGDVVYCSGLDVERKITMGCVNLNLMRSYKLVADDQGQVSVVSISRNQSVVVGEVNPAAGTFLLDETAAGYMRKVEMNNRDADFEARILVRSTLQLNDQIGCTGVMECDWRVVYVGKRISLEVLLNERRLEKVRLN